MTAQSADLPAALDGTRFELTDPVAGRVSCYADQPGTNGDRAAKPLLLIHSINAAAAAHEVRPLYDHYRSRRPVYALDLPGYGFSERSDRAYVPALMVAGIRAVLEEIRSRHGERPIDALAVSLSCEFLGRLACEWPEAFDSVALVSSTGFQGNASNSGDPQESRGSKTAYRIVSAPVIGRSLFRLLTSRPSVRFFLRKTWGRKNIDERMFEYSCRTARQPGARHAPLHFVSGFLFSRNPLGYFTELRQPCWLSHGERGDFTDFDGAAIVADEPNWRISVFSTGALPYFEVPERFVRAYDAFLADASAGRAVNPEASDRCQAPSS
jgi:pimeloyl-ACP methyl ester carboxylesterase